MNTLLAFLTLPLLYAPIVSLALSETARADLGPVVFSCEKALTLGETLVVTNGKDGFEYALQTDDGNQPVEGALIRQPLFPGYPVDLQGRVLKISVSPIHEPRSPVDQISVTYWHTGAAGVSVVCKKGEAYRSLYTN